MKSVKMAIIALMLVSMAFIGGCVTTLSSPSASVTPSQSASVAIKGFAFDPQEVTIVRGGTVTWTNEDSASHDVDFAGVKSPMLGKSETYTKRFDTTGRFNYSCDVHPNMKGAVKVV